jgi:hypothetical protein
VVVSIRMSPEAAARGLAGRFRGRWKVVRWGGVIGRRFSGGVLRRLGERRARREPAALVDRFRPEHLNPAVIVLLTAHR